MIQISLFRDSDGSIRSFKVLGHADAGPHGQDIICAAVSAITQTAVMGLERHLKREFTLDMADGRLGLDLQDAPDERTGAVLETMALGLAEIARNYPKRIRIQEHRR